MGSIAGATVFRDRRDAGEQLARRLRAWTLRDPLVLGIPCGGVIVGAAVARGLGAELDLVLARKLRAPGRPELAIGAVDEEGRCHLNEAAEGEEAYLQQERDFQLAELDRRRALFRAARPPAAIGGRSAVLTDDGVATGSTIDAARRVVAARGPRELIVAVPVASRPWLETARRAGATVVCLVEPATFRAVGQFYRAFPQIDEAAVLEVLRSAAPPPGPSS